MKKNIETFLTLFLIITGSSSALIFAGDNNFSGLKSQPDTLRVLAVMAEFSPDNDDATFGDGTFGSIYSEDYGTTIIDPLPHDAQYFRDHLRFANNNYSKVSNGLLVVEYKVIDQIFKVHSTMRYYSPDPNDSQNFLPIADFASEVWELLDKSNQKIDYQSLFLMHS